MTIYPNAKINLGLNVVERRADGYHNIEAVFHPIPFCDILNINLLPEGAVHRFRQTGFPLDCQPGENLVMRAVARLEQGHPLPPLDIHLHKVIPSGAGLGGGSADAAFALKGINRLCKLGLTDDELETLLAPIGADCPFFVRNTPVFATGIGTQFHPVSLQLKGWHILLVLCETIHVSTREAYAGIQPALPATHIPEQLRQHPEQWKDTLTNDFERTVFTHHPTLATLKHKLYDLGATYAAMSGSGSALFGLFRSPLPHPETHFPEQRIWQGIL